MCLFVSMLCSFGAIAQQTPPSPDGPSMVAKPGVDDSVTVTIILKHQQDKNLPEIRRILEAQGFWELFPPADARVVSWTLAMGLGHIVTLKLTPSALRRLNLAVENGAWGAFDSEFYITYDYKPIWLEYIEQREDGKDERN